VGNNFFLIVGKEPLLHINKMKKLLLIALLLMHLKTFSQSFKDGNYKLNISYVTNLNTNEELAGVTSVILQSSLNKITIVAKTTTNIFTIKSKEVSQDGITTGDMEYRAVDKNGIDYLFSFQHRSSKSYSIILVSGVSWLQFHVSNASPY
jgi:hypothetical protein